MSNPLSQADQVAAKKARENENKEFMRQLEADLQDLLKQSETPAAAIESRHQTVTKVQQALQDRFGFAVTVQSIGLDRAGLSLSGAPLELAVVDDRSDSTSLPRLDQLYHPLTLAEVLRSSGVPVRLYTPPKWIFPESIERPFVLPETSILSPALELVLLPPDPSHALHATLLDRYIQSYPNMRGLIGLAYILATTESSIVPPPLTSRIISYLVMAYYSQKSMNIGQAKADSTRAPVNPPSPSIFYSHPPTVILPNGTLVASSCQERPVLPFSSAPADSELSSKRQSHSVAYDLLDMLTWWDQLYWDQNAISPTSSVPLRRTFDTHSNGIRTWDWNQAPLILQDPVNPLNNLGTLLTRTDYAEIRRSFRHLERNLRAGLHLSIARAFMRPLHPKPGPSPSAARLYSTGPFSSYGTHLTNEMITFYRRNRPTREDEIQRWKVNDRLRNIIRKWYGPSFVPALFGSSRYGVSDRGSDLDIVILDWDRPNGFEHVSKSPMLPKIYQLQYVTDSGINYLLTSSSCLAGSLRAAGFTQVVTIAKAKTPIIKATDPQTGLKLDININSRLGLYNTQLLQHYCRLWPPLSNLIYVIKKWAKGRGLNDPSARVGGATFSSYCLTLMTVGFLQSHGVLPNLQGIPPEQRRILEQEGSSPRFHITQMPIHWWEKVSSTTRVKCVVDWYSMPVEDWKPAVNPPLGQAFYAWLSYYGYDHKYDEFAVRIAEGGVVPRRTKAKERKVKQEESTGTTIDPETVNPIGERNLDHHDQEHRRDEVVVEAVSEDVSPKALETIAEKGVKSKEADVLKERVTPRESLLSEPAKWSTSPFVVADPFIYEKNCAISISKSTLADFVLECRQTLKAIDEGVSLENILSQISERNNRVQEKRNANREAKRKAKAKGAKAYGGPKSQNTPSKGDPKEELAHLV